MRALLVAAVLTTASPALANEQSGGITVAYELEKGIASTFVFRGIPLYSTPRIPSHQTSLTAILGGLGPGELSLNTFAAFALKDRDEQFNGETEIDFEVAYSLELNDRFEVGGGYQVFLLPKDDPIDSSHEFQAFASMRGLPVTPTVAVWVDPIRLKGAYGAARVGKEFSVGDVTLEPAISAGVQKYKDVRGGFNDVTLLLAGRWTLPYGVYMSALTGYAYAYVLDGDYIDRSVYWYYLGVGYER